MNRNQTLGYHVLRLAVTSVFLIHGTTRIANGVAGFSGYWQGTFGLPPGPALVMSWVVTLVELAGGLCLAAGRFVAPLAAWFALQLAVGIATIHAHEGWFVVGAGRNGSEYSALIIAALGALVLLRPTRA